jgi:hypothetical protein
MSIALLLAAYVVGLAASLVVLLRAARAEGIDRHVYAWVAMFAFAWPCWLLAIGSIYAEQWVRATWRARSKT